ncbi:MAG: ABC transporter substrate-binding protein [Bacteroides sp.]|nr:ABC transporter substrate-binding protein [Eubacterium sp.]MCM1419447.1 ABC transporter substrate-binding protein [Roseburia sp.]MCM1463285.1 ABC transporter substrate-binding protein [Bacteroides sp.]
MKKRKILAALIVGSMALNLSGCSGENEGTGSGSGSASTPAPSQNNNNENVGDHLTLKVLTHRTDRVEDGSLAEMTKAFEEANNCTVEYQGFTDYGSDVPTMMNTTEYGDVLMIPDTVKLKDLPSFFEPLGTYEEIDAKYNWASQKMYDGVVYGIAHLGSIAGGICYNKRIWREAGVTTLPTSPEEFIADLKLIRDNTDAIPYYTNFADASWTIVQWASLVNSASGSSTYETDILTSKRDLFVPGDAYYEVYKLMYEIFADPTLHEEDPMTSDWEGCKAAINDGRIATMVMGSWAVSQFQEAGDHPEDIGYMPAPFNVNGKQYAESASDYCMGVNKNRSDEIKALGKKYIEWFVEDSGFAEQEGSIGAVKGSPLPDYLTDFENCELFLTEPAPEGLVGVWDAINNESEVGTWQGDAANFKIRIAEAAFAGEGLDQFESVLTSANEKWNATRDKNAEFAAYIG